MSNQCRWVRTVGLNLPEGRAAGASSAACVAACAVSKLICWPKSFPGQTYQVVAFWLPKVRRMRSSRRRDLQRIQYCAIAFVTFMMSESSYLALSKSCLTYHPVVPLLLKEIQTFHSMPVEDHRDNLPSGACRASNLSLHFGFVLSTKRARNCPTSRCVSWSAVACTNCSSSGRTYWREHIESIRSHRGFRSLRSVVQPF